MDCLPDFAINGETTFCQGETASFTLPEENYTSIYWIKDGQTISNETILTWSFVIAEQTTLEVEANTDLCNYTYSIVVNVFPAPELNVSIWGNTINTFPLQETYQWYFGSQLIVDFTSPSYSAIASGEYSVVVWDENGCTTGATVNLELCPPPPTIFGETLFCGPSFYEYATDTEEPNMYWYLDGNSFSSGPSMMIALNTPGVHTISLSVGNDLCMTSSEVEVTATGLPQITLNGGVFSTDFIGDSYQWYLNGNILEGATGTSVPVSGPGFYTVIISVGESCDVESESIFVPVDVFENELTSFDVFPNPCIDEVQLKMSNTSTLPARISILDVTGKLIESTGVFSLQQIIDLAHLAPGTYLIQVIDQSHRPQTKLLRKG
ncbi:MAG: hypothetical protein RL204_1383 [Bacteroidota bacterium]|jgi:hypothetical protein